MNLVHIGTNEFFPQLIRLAANERRLQSRPYSNQKFERRDQSATAELFLACTRRFFPTGTRDGDRRGPREPRPYTLGRRNAYRDLPAAGELLTGGLAELRGELEVLNVLNYDTPH